MSERPDAAMLLICPTPIGNLEDVTPRQRQALAGCDIIACEDTRHTGKLLELLGIARPEGRPRLVSYHEHNAEARTPELVAHLQRGQTVVLVSDAGTPTISDPGYRLVHAARAAGVRVSALPGPVAAMVALSASGLPSDRFFFEGFLPARAARRHARLQELRALHTTVILYESPRRVVDLLDDIADVFGPEHVVCAARELTKLHEEYLRAPCAQVRDTLGQRAEVLGEFVVLIAPFSAALSQADRDAAIDEKIDELLDQGMSPRGIKEVIGELFALKKSEVYPRIQAIQAQRSHRAPDG